MVGFHFLTATDEEIEKEINSPEVVGKTHINLFHPLTHATMQLFWRDYHCDRCGRCCRGELTATEGGLVLVDVEAKRLAGIKQMPVEEFKNQFTIMREDRLIMNYPCPFYDANIPGCSIYEDRPIVCRLYPINLPVKPSSYHPEVDGTYLLTVDSHCPEARKVAVKWLKAIRDASNYLKSLSKEQYDDIQNRTFTSLKAAREWQKGMRVI